MRMAVGQCLIFVYFYVIAPFSFFKKHEKSLVTGAVIFNTSSFCSVQDEYNSCI